MLKYSSTKVLKLKPGGQYTMPAPFPGSSPTRVILYLAGYGTVKPTVHYVGKPFTRLRDILFRDKQSFRYAIAAFDREHIIFSTVLGKVGPLFGMYYPSISQLFSNGYGYNAFGRLLAAVPQKVTGLDFPFFLEAGELDKPHRDHYSVFLTGRVAEIEGNIKARKEMEAQRVVMRAQEKAQKAALRLLAAEKWKPFQQDGGM